MIEEPMNEKVLGVKVYDWQKVELTAILKRLGYTVPGETNLLRLFNGIKPNDRNQIIIDAICDVMGLPYEEVKVRPNKRGNRTTKPVKIRMFICYYLHIYNRTLTLGECGLAVGVKRRHAKEHLSDLGDHSVVIYYLSKIEGGIDIKDQAVTTWIEAIDRELIKKLND